jgi:pimeloyl-ACP methyl ester carboxylesterase
VYPINRQIKAFGHQVRFVIPDRSGYGRSARLPRPMAMDFHQQAAEETLLVLDALGIHRAIFWGHSDGAVIAAKIGLSAPQRCVRLILEAFHFYRCKPTSRSFFLRFARRPEEINEKAQRLLVVDHGEERWRKVVQRNCRAWLRIAAHTKRLTDDLYDGQLGGLRVPVAFVHGRRDPRTEEGEMERVSETLVGAEMRFIKAGRHSPHSEKESWRECNRILGEYLARK